MIFTLACIMQWPPNVLFVHVSALGYVSSRHVWPQDNRKGTYASDLKCQGHPGGGVCIAAGLLVLLHNQSACTPLQLHDP